MPDNPTEGFHAMQGRSPDEAGFFWSGGPVEVAERTWFQSRFSGCTGFETDEGVVLVDSGLEQMGPARGDRVADPGSAQPGLAPACRHRPRRGLAFERVPRLQPLYDEAEFIVRNVIRYYGGWWNGRPSDLKPAARAELAQDLASLCGGAAALLEHARRLADAGELRRACHLADYALEAEPATAAVQEAVADLYDRRAGAETSLMARNLFRSAATYAREGRPFR